MYSHVKAPGSSVTIPHCTSQDLPIVDRVIEPQTIANFLSWLFTQGHDAKELFPFLQEPFPPGSNEESIIGRVMARIGSNADGNRLCLVGKNIQFLKARLWEGIIPLSEQRWQEKGLDRPEYFDLACQHLTAVVAVFEYMNASAVRVYLRDTFNFIYDHWADADTVLNQRRAEKGKERISLASLWTEYIAAHFEMMTERAHRWVILHVKALRAPMLRKLAQHKPLIEGSGIPDATQWMLTDRLHMVTEIAAHADWNIMLPMQGYKGYTPPQRDGPAELHVADCGKRGKAYSERLRLLTRQVIARDITCNRGSTEYDRGSGASFRRTGIYQIKAQNQTREEMRGAPIEPMPREPWITSCMKNIESATKKVGGYSMAIYRLTYGQSESEWKAFIEKLEAHISDWGKGQTGSSALKPYLKLQWLDGKDLGISEGDIDATKRHFNKMVGSDERLDHFQLQTRAFLVIDSASFASYTDETYGPATSNVMAGDFTGFVLAVDPEFDLEEGIERPDESPRFNGQMRILGSLVWGDIFSLFSCQAAELSDFWPLAIEHPHQVYVGPTIPWQLFLWRKQTEMRWTIIRELIKYTKRRLEALATGTPVTPATAPA